MTREDTLSVELDLLRRRLERLRDGAIDLADDYALPEDEEHPRERRARADGVAHGLALALRLLASAERRADLDLEPRPEAP